MSREPYSSSCHCDCCHDSREEEKSVLPSLPPPPPFAPTNEQLVAALNGTFDRYPIGIRMNMPMVVNVMLQDLRPNVTQFRQAETLVVDFIRGQAAAGVLSITKGPKGGIMRNSMAEQVKAKIEAKKTIAGPVYSVGESPLQNASSVPAINNHTCPHCGNTACSKSERSCWKCGGSL